MQEIQVVCNLNVARSPFLSAYLQLHFPHVKFTSSGVNAREYAETSSIALQIAKNWGFPFAPKKSTIPILDSRMKYLPVDESTKVALSDLGAETCLLSDSSIESTNIIRKPVDPVNFQISEFTYELAVLLNYGVKMILSEFPPLGLHDIAVIEFSGDHFEGISLSEYVSERQDEVYIVNACLRNLQVHNLLVEFFNLSPLLDYKILSIAYSSTYEILEPEKLLCSVEWRQWLYHLASIRPVVLLVSPVELSEQMTMPETVLATIWANERVQLVQ